MKKLLFTLFAAFISNSAVAEWIYVGFSETNTHFYVDGTDISASESGNMIKIWVLADYEQEQRLTAKLKYLSLITQYEYDCKEKQMRMLYFSAHSERMREGQVVFLENNPSNSWMPIPPMSVSRAIQKIVCGEQELFVKRLMLKSLGAEHIRALRHEAPDWKSPEWRYYDVDGYDKPVFYYDPPTIQKNDHFRKVWSLESGDNYDYDVRALFEFDCQKERVKILIYETAPSALHRPDRLTLRPLSPFDEREWVSLKRKMPDRPWHSFKQEKTLFNIVCDK